MSEPGFPCARVNCGNEMRLNGALGLWVCAACGAWCAERPSKARQPRGAGSRRFRLPGPYPRVRWTGEARQ